MKRFEELEVLGNGGFGVVTKCRDRETGDFVAIKKMKQRYASFDECLQLKEVKSLRKIKHTNVVKLLQVFRENEYLHLVFELMGKSLLQSTAEHGPYSEAEAIPIMTQILTGLAHVHRQGFFHRDMKPDNLLWKDDNLKIADFGLAREIRSRPPFTEYCGTRWYRAPEVILRSDFYNSPVDIWAAGAIMAELFIGKPLFQGTSENDQIYKIFGVLGVPNQRTWPDGIRLANRLGIRFPNSVPIGLASALPDLSPAGMSLVSEMLRFDPTKRPSAAQALQHEWFRAPQTPPAIPMGIARKAGSVEPPLDDILMSIMASPGKSPTVVSPTLARTAPIEQERGRGLQPMAAQNFEDSDDIFAGL
jgi:protein kinase